ncbi:HAD-IA family hydrolase [Cerasicoccus arenae]|uniref:Hydrolase n=1 Tax=Cerasicoccus arenae TaxID=424488 RepID=A0A8J3DAC7_9BACT|nr:HAD-IA family hydrolase [Cerasicoccus arenae]MBK1859016.1 HAD-IA family hydrolase [Cerasicoccus arenae]GHB94730.1 hydrolase [Cerasicoccus arenae]
MNLDGVQAITFDAAGTLMVPHPSVGEVYAEVLAAMGYSVDPSLLEQRFRASFKAQKSTTPEAVLDRASWRKIVAGTLKDLTPSADFETQFDALWHTFAEPNRWRVLPGVESTLASLQRRGFRLFVLSNNDSRLRRILVGLGLDQFFEAIFISAELGVEKPSPRIFQLVEANIGVPAASILHVGDSPLEDIEGAQNAGWCTALVGSKTKMPNRPTHLNCPVTISSLFEPIDSD